MKLVMLGIDRFKSLQLLLVPFAKEGRRDLGFLVVRGGRGASCVGLGIAGVFLDARTLKSLGATTIKCVVVDADEDGGLVWQVAELFNQPQKTVLERAELAMKCVGIVRRKGGQHARGGPQANDKGMSAAERILGVSRRDLGRFEKIDGISAEAKEEARRAQLDDNQDALLAIAKVPAEKQVEKVREL